MITMQQDILIEQIETDLEKHEFVSYNDALSYVKNLIVFSNLANLVENYKINKLDNGNFKAVFIWKKWFNNIKKINNVL